MGIHFEKERYRELGDIYDRWWEGRLGRPLVKVMVRDAFQPEREEPNVPLLSQANCNQLQYTPEEIIDRIDYELSKCAFLGDAFPMVNMWTFGPGALAGFCGAELKNDTGSVWYQAPARELSDIHIQYDPENIWAKRIKDLYRAGMERWQGKVVLGMPDLGGFQDVIANFTGSQELIFALIDEEEEVHRLQQEVYEAWMAAYRDLAGVLAQGNPGYTDWGGMFSTSPSYILQDDFAYMIGPDMYMDYGYPEIKRASEELSHTIYHLDGVGNLNHLPALLRTPALNAVQWVYGEGQPSARHWMEVYEKIYQAGKGIEVIGDLDDFYALHSKYGDKLFYQCTVDGGDGMAARLMDEKDCIHNYRVFPREMLGEVMKLLELVKKYAV
ncbi:hypothetical protein NXH76_07210 [Blautia schinkii]|nr:hypothetical protein [Blautia schinkii]